MSADEPARVPHVIAVDPGRKGTPTVITHILDEDMAGICAYAGNLLDADPSATATVNVIGFGAAVYDRLREQGYTVEPRRGDVRYEIDEMKVIPAGAYDAAERPRSWKEVYGIRVCSACGKGFLASVRGIPREECPFCGSALAAEGDG